MMAEIHLGISNGDRVSIPLFHTLIAGQTQLSGKTTTIKALAPEASEVEDVSVLIFDTKPTGQEYPEYPQIPVCYQHTTDSLVLMGLLESIFRRRLTPYYSTLNRLTDNAQTLEDMRSNAVKMEETARSGFVKDACHTLADLLRRLIAEIEGIEMVPILVSRKGVHVMAINRLSIEAQQLVLKTAFEQGIRGSNHANKIFIIDESWRFLPEGYSSACKRAVQDMITQGAKTKRFVWLATQFLAPTDKDPLKGMPLKLLGRQDHTTEIEHTLKLIPEGKRTYQPEDIMRLKKGEFIYVNMEGYAKKVYVTPPWERQIEQLARAPGLDEVTQVAEDDSEFWLGVSARLERLEAKVK